MLGTAGLQLFQLHTAVPSNGLLYATAPGVQVAQPTFNFSVILGAGADEQEFLVH